jgi:organic hydroperoxide reductase OsmC/OhrA
VATVRARAFEFAVSLDDGWVATSDRGGEPIPHDGSAWTPEHLLLVGLARCSLTALEYHAQRAGLTVTAEADASGTVTRREDDGRFAFVEIDVEARLTIPEAPEPTVLRELVAKAERDCFVGASLTVKPRYTWLVNDEPLA